LPFWYPLFCSELLHNGHTAVSHPDQPEKLNDLVRQLILKAIGAI
jgi:hypothetical protein